MLAISKRTKNPMRTNQIQPLVCSAPNKRQHAIIATMIIKIIICYILNIEGFSDHLTIQGNHLLLHVPSRSYHQNHHW